MKINNYDRQWKHPGMLTTVNIFIYIHLKVYFSQVPGYFMAQLISIIILCLQLICFILLLMGSESGYKSL